MEHRLIEMLQSLKQMLIRERNCARNLDMQGLAEALRDKADLISRLQPRTVSGLDDAARELLREIDRENRRNTRLYRSAREVMLGIRSVHCRHAGFPGYGPTGSKDGVVVAGNMLSGKV